MSFRSHEDTLKRWIKIHNMVKELLQTEENYVNGLSIVVEKYLNEFFIDKPIIPIPHDLREDMRPRVFANIEDIYTWHKEYFLPELIKHSECLSDLAKVFIDSEYDFEKYARYGSNRNMSEFIVSKYSKYFNAVQDKLKKQCHQRLDFNGLLMSPLQRLAQYKIILEGIAKQLKELKVHYENIPKAVQTIQKVLNNVNDFIALQGIRNFDGFISDQGQLIFHNNLLCKYNEKKMRYYVFLFKRLLIFTERHGSKCQFSLTTYNYKMSIPMNKIHIRELPNKRFLLKSTTPDGSEMNVTCYGDNEDHYSQWVHHIQEQIKLQADLINNLVNPTGFEREVM
ncbi:rho guanine nucleotide exchange factor 25-like [Haematobia irritans]|uniref:rho guanine nucleotide exchange factor 25-like n=1 Tax=Haematobia irritans TaxID=7368 RepID=UPI003F4F7951